MWIRRSLPTAAREISNLGRMRIFEPVSLLTELEYQQLENLLERAPVEE